jgi:hypothetical protein
MALRCSASLKMRSRPSMRPLRQVASSRRASNCDGCFRGSRIFRRPGNAHASSWAGLGQRPQFSELLPVWWTPKLECFTRLEGRDGTATVQPTVQAGGGPAVKGRGVSVVQAGDLGELLGIGVEHLGIGQQRVAIVLAERGRPMPRFVVEAQQDHLPCAKLVSRHDRLSAGAHVLRFYFAQACPQPHRLDSNRSGRIQLEQVAGRIGIRTSPAASL